jgi:hypothetical protein|uniref:Uncharacterized protein n=2 Tax=root TaxID=1 RepID=A0A8S5U9L9_9CAUD|nr:MAG TPA: hypothetical protein [Siphoviridae sp. ct7aK2]
MCERIRKGCIVRVSQAFIKEYGRADLNPDDTWNVVNVVPVCGDKKVANLVNTRSRLKVGIFTCNLILIQNGIT